MRRLVVLGLSPSICTAAPEACSDSELNRVSLQLSHLRTVASSASPRTRKSRGGCKYHKRTFTVRGKPGPVAVGAGAVDFVAGRDSPMPSVTDYTTSRAPSRFM